MWLQDCGAGSGASFEYDLPAPGESAVAVGPAAMRNKNKKKNFIFVWTSSCVPPDEGEHERPSLTTDIADTHADVLQTTLIPGTRMPCPFFDAMPA